MEVKCYIAMFVFAALSTVLGYMICVRLRTTTPCPALVPALPASGGPVATTPLLRATL